MGKADNTDALEEDSKPVDKKQIDCKMATAMDGGNHKVHFDSETVVIPRISFVGEEFVEEEVKESKDDDTLPDYDAKGRFRRRANSDCHRIKAALSKKLQKKKTEATKTCSKPASSTSTSSEQPAVAKLDGKTTQDYDQFYEDLEAADKITVLREEDEEEDNKPSRPRAYSEGAKSKPLKSILKYTRPEATCVVMVHQD